MVKIVKWDERSSFFCFQQPEKPVTMVHKNFYADNSNYGPKSELFASKVVQLTSDTRLYTAPSVFLSLSLLIIALSSVCAI